VFLETAKRTGGLLAITFACVALGRLQVRRLDAILLVAIGLELALMIKLCLASAGAWYNYAIPSACWLAVLVGRSADRLLEQTPSPRTILCLSGACLLLLALDVRNVGSTIRLRRTTDQTLRAVLGDERVRVERHERYFAGPLQHFNRRFGNADLLHDEWLYGAFEAIGAAEPRREWLRDALDSGSIVQVILPKGAVAVSGVPENLRDVGYEPVAEFGELRVWENRAKLIASGGRSRRTSAIR
jgi:hypothetical protein